MPITETVHFFMVWNKEGKHPRVTHKTYKVAEAEAARLAAKHPGRKFIVLQAVTKISEPPPEPMSAQAFGV